MINAGRMRKFKEIAQNIPFFKNIIMLNRKNTTLDNQSFINYINNNAIIICKLL